MDNQILINRYLNSLRRSGKSILTLSAYATDLKQFSVAISPKPFTALSSSLFTVYCLPFTHRFSPNSRARKLTTIREFLKWCHQKGYLKTDLSSEIKLLRRQTVQPAKLLSPAQISRLRRVADTKERLILELIIGTNLKLSAIVRLKMKDITPLFLRSCGAGSRFAGQSLDYYLAQFPRGPKSYLLANKFNRPMSTRTLSSILKNLSSRAGVKHGTPRNLRVRFHEP